MTDTELLSCPDHTVWAEEFCRIAKEINFDPSTQDGKDWVGTWIANAMMNGYDRAARVCCPQSL